MKSTALIICASVLAGCTTGPFALRALPPEPSQDQAIYPTPAVALRPSVDLVTPPPAAAPLQPEAGIGDSAFKVEQARALQGDKDSALRVAQMFREGSNGVPRDERKMVRWLRHASELENGLASYQLYLHYLSRGLDRDAVRYENRALRQGFTPPPRLDPRRG